MATDGVHITGDIYYDHRWYHWSLWLFGLAIFMVHAPAGVFILAFALMHPVTTDTE